MNAWAHVHPCASLVAALLRASGPGHLAVDDCPMGLGMLALDTGCPLGLRSHPKNLIEFGLAEECRR